MGQTLSRLPAGEREEMRRSCSINLSVPDRTTAIMSVSDDDIKRMKVDMIVEVFKALPKEYQQAIMGYLNLQRLPAPAPGKGGK